MYGLQDWAAVQRVYKQTHSKHETAKILKISRNTVKKLLELKEEPTYKRTVYKSCLDEYKELIIEWRCAPYEFNGTRIFRELKAKGYTGDHRVRYYIIAMNIKLIFVLWYLPLPHRLYSTFGFAETGEMDGEEVIAALKI